MAASERVMTSFCDAVCALALVASHNGADVNDLLKWSCAATLRALDPEKRIRSMTVQLELFGDLKNIDIECKLH